MQPDGSNHAHAQLPFEAAMQCLDDLTLDDLVAGRLSGPLVESAERHLDACADCSALVAALAGGGGRALEPGDAVGRHRVIATLGRGGMGVVYLAHDPELDRRVALKLVRPEASAATPERLIAEAQTMARLNHPNVATIHEVGRAGGDVYFSMEYVEGTTLRAWLSAAPRAPRLVREVLAQAADGLAAAHAAGVVHGDFKPDNVLVGGDGRARVTDFGLSRAAIEARADEAPRLAGTPAYMAPEQLEGRAPSARADVFALAVSVLEALAGERPFTGSTPRELEAAIARGVPAGKLAALSAAERVVVTRALAPNPRERLADVRELAEALRASAAARGRAPIGIALGGAAVACAIATAVVVGGRAPRDAASSQAEAAPRCPAPSADLGSIWSDARLDRIRAAFQATKSPLAEKAAAQVEAQATQRIGAWQRARGELCAAEAIDMGALRCLDRRAASLDALLGRFERADVAAVAEAPRSLADLPALSGCAMDVGAATEARPSAPEALAALEALERDTARLRAVMAPVHASDLAGAGALVEQARGVGYRPSLALALLEAARVARAAGDLERARSWANEAQTTAEAAGTEALAARAWLEILAVAGAAGRSRDVLDDAPRAAAAIARAGDPPELVAALGLSRGLSLTALGRLDEAETSIQSARDAEARVGEPSLRSGALLTALGDVARRRGRFDQALALHREAEQADVALLGEGSPGLARHRHNQAGVLRESGQLEQALVRYGEALALERPLGEASPALGRTENSIGLTLRQLGRAREAREHLERALAILREASHPDRSLALLNLAGLDASERKHDAAIARLDEALALLEPTLGKDHLRVAEARWLRAQSLASSGKMAQAKQDREEAQRAATAAASSDPAAATLRDTIARTALTPQPVRAGAAPAGARPEVNAYGSSTSWEPR